MISHFLIPLKPIAWQRARVNTVGNKPRFYDAQEHEKLVFALTVEKQFNNQQPYDSAVHVDVTFYMQLPKNKQKVTGNYHCGVPDADNLLKFVLDCLQNGGILINDKIVSSIHARKIYDPVPRTEITITSLEGR